MADKLFDKTTAALGSSLNFRQLRHNLITSNIANADTPGYKALRVDFEKAMQDALDTEGNNGIATTSREHYAQGGGGLEHVDAEIYQEPDFSPSNDLNTVNVESEMTKLSENQILYDAATRLLNKKFGLLRYAITEGGKL
ncbi:MAG: flagellar basal body rod protein FlgB [Oligoflexia bacterium]|nr:flagellar basal body rod protein FlgB [Oligoflexia bacterium]